MNNIVTLAALLNIIILHFSQLHLVRKVLFDVFSSRGIVLLFDVNFMHIHNKHYKKFALLFLPLRYAKTFTTY